MRVIGIDPGLASGAIAMYDGHSVVVEDMPTLKVKKGKKERTEVILPQLADLFNLFFAGADHAFIEQVSAMPGQGVTSTFNFGMAYGFLQMGVAMANIPSTLVSPVKWKMMMGLNSDANKSLLRANQLFPRESNLFARKMDHNRAEAALIAWYGYRLLTTGKVEKPDDI